MSIVQCAFEVLNAAKFVEKTHHDVIGALLRYIFYEHFLPHLLLRPHYIGSLVTWDAERVDRYIATVGDHGSHRDWVQN